jgi:hypothetical protein
MLGTMSATALRIGVLLPTRQGGGLEAAPLEQVLELAERAEALGLDSVWAGESVLARPRHDPYTVLAAAAARTRRLTLGAAVALRPRCTRRSSSRTGSPRSASSRAGGS